MTGLFKGLAKVDARVRIAISLFAAALVWFVLLPHVRLPTRCIATWDVFAFCVLSLAWLTILFTPQAAIRARARAQDPGRTVVFIFAIVAACAGLFAVGFLFYTNKHAQQAHLTSHLLLSVIAVISSWSLVHTAFSLRYAHTYYGDHDDPQKKEHLGGLEFPNESHPSYLDFAYFSFVIGMTFQVSDVQITSRQLRVLVLVHGMLSFAFNTVILALTINTLSSLL